MDIISAAAGQTGSMDIRNAIGYLLIAAIVAPNQLHKLHLHWHLKKKFGI